MKALIAALLLAAAWPVLAEQPAATPDPDAAVRKEEADARARIAAQRAEANAKYKLEEKACRKKFAVTSCVEKAARAQRAVLDDLRHQEIAINDAERQRNAIARQKELQERVTPEHQREDADRAAKAREDSQKRQAEYDQKMRDRAADQAERAAHPRTPKEAPGAPTPQGVPHQPERAINTQRPSPDEVAENRARYEQHLKEAEDHRKDVEQRNAERAKPAASALPPPPN